MTKDEKRVVEIQNYVRELEKSLLTLNNVEKHLRALAIGNAALHMATEVIPSPLYVNVVESIKGIKLVMKTWKRQIPKISTDPVVGIQDLPHQ